MPPTEINPGAISVFYKTFESSHDQGVYYCYYAGAVNLGKAKDFGVQHVDDRDLLFVPFWFSSKYPRYSMGWMDIEKHFKNTLWSHDGVVNRGFLFKPYAPREETGLRMITILGRWPERKLELMPIAASLTETAYNRHRWSMSILGLMYTVRVQRDGEYPYFKLVRKRAQVERMIDTVRNSVTMRFNPIDTRFPFEWYIVPLGAGIRDQPSAYLHHWMESSVETVGRNDRIVRRFDNSILTANWTTTAA